MKLHTIKPTEGAIKSRTRVGRGVGSGLGKTSGRGEKGQKQEVDIVINKDLKVDNYHYIDVYLKEDLLMLNSKQFMLYLI